MSGPPGIPEAASNLASQELHRKDPIMISSSRTSLAVAVLATALAGGVHAQVAKTRAQVNAELTEAIRTGNMLAGGESGLTMRELAPQRYGAPAPTTTTRAEVQAQLREAERTGDLLAVGESGLRQNQLRPDLFPPQVLAAGKTRAEVKAELQDALRTGDMIANGESGLLLREVSPQRYANVRPLQRDGIESAGMPAATRR
jgi:predicted RNase H-like HicB family nuclease